MKKTKITITIISLIAILLTAITPITKATINPEDYKPGGISAADVQTVTTMANPIIGTIKTIGIVIAVITLIALGLKYMMGSTQEKAEYKKSMIPYLVGVTLVVAITQFVGLILEIVQSVDA